MQVLEEYAKNPENPLSCTIVADWYERQGHLGPALSFWLRAAEFSEDDLLSYNCLLKGALCYEKQGGRSNSVRVMIHNAINLIPDRPEAYYLMSRHHERNAQWQDCYTMATVGLAHKDVEKKLLHPVEYPGEYVLHFEKAVAAWWWGRNQESRQLFRWIADNFWDEMDYAHRYSVEDNMTRLGSGPESHSAVFYDPNRAHELRHKFDGYQEIKENYSQVMQDIFVLMATNGKRNGTFVEIGAADAFKRSNTVLLEKQYDWDGISFEYDEKFVPGYAQRKTKLYHTDALTVDYREVLKENFSVKDIDYLQLDIEPCRKTYECLKMIPFDEYRFAVITFEHDYYVDPTREIRDKSRKYLQDMGYVLVANDISPDGSSNFEDWWVHPELVDKSIIDKIKEVGEDVKKADDYIFSGEQEERSVNFNINPNREAKQTVWVVDDFYEDPDAVREFALKQEYHQGGRGRGYIGRRTYLQFLFPGLKERFEKIMGRKITKWEEHGMNGRFQTCWAGDELVYHCDDQTWAAMIYLTPDAPYQCGTTLHAHKKTRIRHSSHPDIMSVFEGENFDGTLYEPVDVLGNVYNRLVIFDAHCLHSASQYFGHSAETGRLWQMFFFD